MNYSIDEVWKRYWKTRKIQYRNKLIENYIHVVRIVASKTAVKLPLCVDVEDLVGIGVFGLMDAIEKYDPSRGVKFETFSFFRIRGEMLDSLRKLDWVPRLIRVEVGRLDKAKARAEKNLSRPANHYEVIQNLGRAARQYGELQSKEYIPSIISLNNSVGNTNGKPADYTAIIKKFIQDGTKQIDKKDLIAFITENLTKREKRIFKLYFYKSLTVDKIARKLGISQSRVCQLLEGARVRLQYQFKRRYAEWVEE